MLATALLLVISIGASLAQNLTLTGSLNESNVSCATLAGYTTLNIGDGTIATTWTINNNLDLSACPNPITIVINGNANLKIMPNNTLSLPNGSEIILNGTGYIWKENPCSASQFIYIGSIKIASCNGGGGGGGGKPLNDFDQINNFGGTGNASSNSPVCTGSTIYLTATPSIAGYTYAWNRLSGFNSTLQNPSLSPATAIMAGDYEVTITNSITTKSIVAATTVVVAPSITNNIGGGTSPICSGSTPALLTGGNGTFTYLWESSTSSSTTGFSPANGINNTQTYQPGALTQTTWFRRSVTSGCTNISAPIEIIVTPNLPVSISIAASANPVCTGIPVTFTATATNEGAAPIYQWKVNNVNVGSNNPLYSYTPTDGDIINCVLISNATCATGSPATSNGITIAIPLPAGPTIFNMGATSTRYQVAGTVTYTATAINNTGIKYALDAISSIENIIDVNTGEVTYSSAWSGTSIITATVSGCPAQTTATHTVATMKTTIGKTWCFALFTATGALTNTGASQIKGDVGTNVGALTGFPPGIISNGGTHEKDALTAQAAIDVVTAYNDLAATPTGEIISGTSLGAVGPGQVLTPNVYYLGGALNIANDLILDGQGDPNALFIFKVNGALTSLTGSRIILRNSTSILNVYFQVYGAVVINAEFAGTLVAKGAITINTGSKLIGRALSVVGAIVVNNSELTSNCSPIIGQPDNSKPNLSTLTPFEFCVENIQTLAYDAALTDFIPSTRPDYYTLKAGDSNLNLNPATFVHGTCLPLNDLILHWSIRNSTDEPIKSVSDVFLTDIIGQVSDYTNAFATKTNIVFQGAVNADVTYKITYWLEDTCGKLSDPKVTTITIKPRPNIIKT